MRYLHQESSTSVGETFRTRHWHRPSRGSYANCSGKARTSYEDGATLFWNQSDQTAGSLPISCLNSSTLSVSNRWYQNSLLNRKKVAFSWYFVGSSLFLRDRNIR